MFRVSRVSRVFSTFRRPHLRAQADLLMSIIMRRVHRHLHLAFVVYGSYSSLQITQITSILHFLL